MFNELFLEDEQKQIVDTINLIEAKIVRANYELQKCDVESFSASKWRRYIQKLGDVKIHLLRII